MLVKTRTKTKARSRSNNNGNSYRIKNIPVAGHKSQRPAFEPANATGSGSPILKLIVLLRPLRPKHLKYQTLKKASQPGRIQTKKAQVKHSKLLLFVYTVLLVGSNNASANPFGAFINKATQFQTHLTLLGKTLVGVALVIAIVKALGNKGVNWAYLGVIAGVGVALTALVPILQFLTT